MAREKSIQSQHSFSLTEEYINLKFSTKYPELYKKPFFKNMGKSNFDIPQLFFTIGYAKKFKGPNHHTCGPLIKYPNNIINMCCLGSLVYALAAIDDNMALNSVESRIEGLLQL